LYHRRGLLATRLDVHVAVYKLTGRKVKNYLAIDLT